MDGWMVCHGDLVLVLAFPGRGIACRTYLPTLPKVP